MKKRTVIIISTVLISAFLTLVFTGLKNARGVPVKKPLSQKAVLKVPFINEQINAQTGIDASVWKKLPETRIEMMYQVTILPWPAKGQIPVAYIKAFHDRKSIYFRVSWEDSTLDLVKAPGKFPDATAILFPMGDSIQNVSLMMGFLGSANIWHWKADVDRSIWGGSQEGAKAYSDFYYPFEEQEIFPVSRKNVQSAVSDLASVRIGTISPKPVQKVEGRGIFEKNKWQVLFIRDIKPEKSEEIDAVFQLGTDRLCAFAIWNGSKGDRGGRKYISEWVMLKVEQ